MCIRITSPHVCRRCSKAFVTQTYECNQHPDDRAHPICKLFSSDVVQPGSSTHTCEPCSRDEAAALARHDVAMGDLAYRVAMWDLTDESSSSSGSEADDKSAMDVEMRDASPPPQDSAELAVAMEVDDRGYVCIRHSQGKDTKGLPCKCRPPTY